MQVALKKTLKKVAAVSTSLALAGITVSGALAAGLGDLPSPFGSSPSMNVVVYGSAGSDMAAVNDVVSALGGAPVSSGNTYTLGGMNTAPLAVVDFEQGERNDLSVGATLSSEFGTEMDETDSIGLKEFSVGIDIGSDKDYDAHEVITLTTGPTLTTALEQADDDFGDKTFIQLSSGTIGYQVKFEENLDAVNNLTAATSDDTVTIPFLGKNLLIISATASSITAYAGDKVSLRIGDTVKVGDKTVKLDGVDDNSALITVDGEAESIDEADRERVAGVEIYVDDVFNSDDDANDKAVLIVEGSTGQAVETYSAGEEYVDEDENHYLWEWNLASLSSINKDSITLGIKLSEDLDEATDTFEPEIMNLGLLKTNQGFLAEGDYLCLPHRYACLLLEGSASDLSWNEYVFDIDTEDLNTTWDGSSSTFAANLNNQNTLRIQARGVGNNRGFIMVDGYAGADETKAQTDTIWLHYNGSVGGLYNGTLAVYYADKDTNKPIRLDLDDSDTKKDLDDSIVSPNGTIMVAKFDNGDYNAPIWVNLTQAHNSVTTKSVFFIVGGLNSASNLTFDFQPAANTTSGIGYLGSADGDSATGDFFYSATDITGYDKDVRKRDGVVVKDPESNLDNDKVVLSVPNDDEYKFWVRVAKPKSGASSSPSSPAAPKAPTLAMKDTEVGDVATLGKNVVAVGGPAVNKVTANLLGLSFPTYGSGVAGLSEGKAMLEMKDLAGGKKALLVYGWEADDTRRAALVVKNSADPSIAPKLKDKMSVMVSGTTLTVSGITVA